MAFNATELKRSPIYLYYSLFLYELKTSTKTIDRLWIAFIGLKITQYRMIKHTIHCCLTIIRHFRSNKIRKNTCVVANHTSLVLIVEWNRLGNTNGDRLWDARNQMRWKQMRHKLTYSAFHMSLTCLDRMIFKLIWNKNKMVVVLSIAHRFDFVVVVGFTRRKLNW